MDGGQSQSPEPRSQEPEEATAKGSAPHEQAPPSPEELEVEALLAELPSRTIEGGLRERLTAALTRHRALLAPVWPAEGGSQNPEPGSRQSGNGSEIQKPGPDGLGFSPAEWAARTAADGPGFRGEDIQAAVNTVAVMNRGMNKFLKEKWTPIGNAHNQLCKFVAVAAALRGGKMYVAGQALRALPKRLHVRWSEDKRKDCWEIVVLVEDEDARGGLLGPDGRPY